MTKQRIVFLTFGGPTVNYHNRVLLICKQAESLNIFNEIRGVTDLDLKDNHPIFWRGYGEFLRNNRRGYGFWLWKPYIIRHTLQDIETNDIIVYMDAGCTINPEGKQRLNEYIDLLNNQSEFDILSFQMHALSEVKYSKLALLEYLNINEIDRNSGQCMATVIILRKGKHSTTVVNKWYETSILPDLINDKHSPLENKLFIDHRHDQSIYSLLVKKMGSIKIADETFFYPNWITLGGRFPFWATRIR